MKNWWKEAVVYQIYPRSFQDTNGDGIGDINGITSKLDYLKELGVDVIWLCPIYKSLDADNGYDISNYTEIDKKYGTMEDFEKLLKEVHKRKMKIIMDAVLNHTSDEHPWFVESRKSKTNKYRNFYLWKPAKNGAEPNNWRSHFGGSAWEYDGQTGEYYLHIWDKKQPDLNWDNKEMRTEIYKMLKWWLDKGIDGFRLDVINFISKENSFPDAEASGEKYASGDKYYVNGPKVNDYLKEMNLEVFSKYDILIVGETAATFKDVNVIGQYVNSKNQELQMVFHENNEILGPEPRKLGATYLERKFNRLNWNLIDMKTNFTAWQWTLREGCWDTVYLGNHDYPRMVSRFGDDKKYRVESAKMLATLLFTLGGTQYIYQGDEIGMTNADFKSIIDYRDVAAVNMYNEYVKNHTEKETLDLLVQVSRDNARTPMQWDDGKNAGFTEGTPWIMINGNYKEINVKKSLEDKNSIFYYYQTLIQMRKTNEIFVYGDYDLLLDKDTKIYAYTRKLNGEILLSVLNFSSESVEFELPSEITYTEETLLIGNYEGGKGSARKFQLKPYEARVYRLKI